MQRLDSESTELLYQRALLRLLAERERQNELIRVCQRITKARDLETFNFLSLEIESILKRGNLK